MTAIATSNPVLPGKAAAVCSHCGQRLGQGSERFCCAGCEAAYAIVQGLGLDQFYRRRQAAGAQLLRPEETTRDYADQVIVDDEGRFWLHLMVDGISCAACAWLIETVLAKEPAIRSARVNLTTRRLKISWDGSAQDANRYAGRIAALGFRLVPFDPAVLAATRNRDETELLKCLAVAGFAAGNVMLLSVAVWAGLVEGMGSVTRDLLHWVSALIAMPAIAYAGRPFFRSAFTALSSGRTNMDVPISIGVLLATGMSLYETAGSGVHAYFDSAAALLFFLLIGRYLDLRARGRARVTAEHLLSLGAAAVTVVQADGSTASRMASSVRQGETVLVATGERIGVDGRVIDGRSDVDASLVTGEAIPIAVRRGADVFAGMINLSAPLRLSVSASGERTLLAEIVRLMEAAEHGRGHFTTLTDRVARAYAPLVHTLAAFTFAGWMAFGDIGWHDALMNAVAVLIITCPCALALAVPVVQVVASGRLMRAGVLLKSATALERLAGVDTVVFDKTGTLTLGCLDLEPDPTRSPDDLRLAASLALSSRHPLARALTRACPVAAVASGVQEHPGQGLSLIADDGVIRLGSQSFCDVARLDPEQVGPELWLAVPGRRPVRFGFTDALRPDAAAVVNTLQAMGMTVRLLSGDRAAVVERTAEAVGIAEWRAGCSPADKVAALARLRAQGRCVLMVGDGLNDAPALAAADVSASPSTAADVSQTSADVVFQGERLAPLLEMLDVAHRSGQLVRQNLALAILYNLGAVPLAMAGLVTPLLAALAMSSSSIVVILNALRLGRKSPPGTRP